MYDNYKVDIFVALLLVFGVGVFLYAFIVSGKHDLNMKEVCRAQYESKNIGYDCALWLNGKNVPVGQK